ncbi:hypothetical protein [Pseudoalteromonas sp. S2755]|uniref:hypothetical protein n=1 Tax=Pseudoalteromonas sp. S2755 TaxID=2066523 RepID=UPI00110AC9E2|nr:hypothetical protein [Pseudoalteromonas sp. S2755]TMN34619.1 hypothetical protein CWC03_16355 [Pseudoalteromonas sp. S2755]
MLGSRARYQIIYYVGTTTVEHSDGTTSRLLGDSVQEGSVYIENDRITGQAPSLPNSEIEV